MQTIDCAASVSYDLDSCANVALSPNARRYRQGAFQGDGSGAMRFTIALELIVRKCTIVSNDTESECFVVESGPKVLNNHPRIMTKSVRDCFNSGRMTSTVNTLHFGMIDNIIVSFCDTVLTFTM